MRQRLEDVEYYASSASSEAEAVHRELDFIIYQPYPGDPADDEYDEDDEYGEDDAGDAEDAEDADTDA